MRKASWRATDDAKLMITEPSAQLNKASAGSLLIKCRAWTDQTGVILVLMGGKLPPRGREGTHFDSLRYCGGEQNSDSFCWRISWNIPPPHTTIVTGGLRTEECLEKQTDCERVEREEDITKNSFMMSEKTSWKNIACLWDFAFITLSTLSGRNRGFKNGTKIRCLVTRVGRA